MLRCRLLDDYVTSFPVLLLRLPLKTVITTGRKILICYLISQLSNTFFFFKEMQMETKDRNTWVVFIKANVNGAFLTGQAFTFHLVSEPFVHWCLMNKALGKKINWSYLLSLGSMSLDRCFATSLAILLALFFCRLLMPGRNSESIISAACMGWKWNNSNWTLVSSDGTKQLPTYFSDKVIS